RIARTVKNPNTDYIYDGVSGPVQCTPVGERESRNEGDDQKRERLKRLIRPEFGLFCESKDVKNAPITGQFSLLAYDPGTDSISGGRRIISFTVVPGSLQRQLEQSFEQRLSATIDTLRSELRAEIDSAQLGTEKLRNKINVELGKFGSTLG